MSTSLKHRLAYSMRAGRDVFRMVSRNQQPMVIEAQTFKDLEAETIGFRSASGDTNDLMPWSQERQQRTSVRLFQRDSMARRTIMMVRDFVTSDGITVQAQHDDEKVQEEIQAEIDRFWNDPVNAMDRRNPDRVQDYQIYGEICMPVRVQEFTGRTRLGWLDPCAIQDVKPDPVTGGPGIVVLPDMIAEKVGMKEMRVIQYDESAGRLVGDCFFYSKGNVMNSLRGLGNLYSSADEFAQMRELFRVEMDRAKMMLRFIWDVTLKGMDENQIKEWLKANGKAPAPNAIKAHNESVEWKAEAPTLNSHEFATLTKSLKERLMGSQGFPNHYFGAGDDANLATADAMDAPTKKSLKARGNEYRWVLQDVLWHHLQSRQAADPSVLRGVDLSWEAPFVVHIPDLADRDLGKVGAAMQQVCSAITVAQDKGWISEDTAAVMFAMVASETGIEIDAADEREKVEADRQKREKEQQAQDVGQENQLRDRLLKLVPGQEGAA